MKTLRKLTANKLIGAVMLMASAVGQASAADLSAVPSGSYQLDPTHAFIHFQYNHLGLSNPTLAFDDFSVDLNLDSTDPTKSILLVTIDPSSIEAGSAIFKEHLSGPDFFDVANFPDIVFQSDSIDSANDGSYTVSGTLTIKDKEHPVDLHVIINAAMNHPMTGKPVVGIGATGKLLRSDFGLDKYVPNVGDEVTLSISAELNKVE